MLQEVLHRRYKKALKKKGSPGFSLSASLSTLLVKEPWWRNAFAPWLDWTVTHPLVKVSPHVSLGMKTRFKKTTQQLSSYPVIPANLVIVSQLDLVIKNPFSGISFTLNSLLHG